MVFLLSACVSSQTTSEGDTDLLFGPIINATSRPLGLNLNADNVEKIEFLTLSFETADNVVWIGTQGKDGETGGRYMAIINTYTDEADISRLINFVNSLSLTDYGIVQYTVRPFQNYRITYNDGTTDFIQLVFTTLFYNDSVFRITCGGNTMELGNILDGIHGEASD